VPDPVIALLGNVLGDGWVAQVSAPLSPSTFDATLMKLSTQGSNVAVATNSGTFTVELYSGSTIVAASVFPWIKNGAELIAAQPGAVNTWIKQYPNADGYTFNTKVTFTESAEDMTTVRTSQVYSGVTVSSTSQTLPTPRRTGPISPEQP
jgi:hypothetical protein